MTLQRGLIQSEHWSIQGADICQFKDAVGGPWDGTFVQMTAGALNAGVEYLKGNGFILYRETWEQQLHLVGTLLPGFIVIGLPEGRGQETRWWGQALPENCIPIVRPGEELSLVAQPGEAVTALMVREVDCLNLFECLTGLAAADFPGQGPFLSLKAGTAAPLLRLWKQALAQASALDSCDWGVEDLVAPFLDALVLPLVSRRIELPKAELLADLLRVAEASNFRASVPEISVALNISRRSIEYLFQQLIGKSPQAYFTVRRLNLCNQALTEACKGETTVATIATRYGFYELGRFASLYNRYFGELPSTTLQAPRGQIAAHMSPVIYRAGHIGE